MNTTETEIEQDCIIGTPPPADGRRGRKLKPKMAPHDFLTKRQAAAILNVCTRTLDNLRADGKLTYYKMGRSVFYKEADLWECVQSCRVAKSANDPS